MDDDDPFKDMDPEEIPAIPMAELLPAVNADMVKFTRRLHQRAKQGGIAGIAVVLVTPDGVVETAFEGEDEVWAELLAGVTCLQSRLVEAGTEDDDG